MKLYKGPFPDTPTYEPIEVLGILGRKPMYYCNTTCDKDGPVIGCSLCPTFICLDCHPNVKVCDKHEDVK